MDIERHNFDARNECHVKRDAVKKSKFEEELDNTWGAEAPRQESKFRRDFWVGAMLNDQEPNPKQIT